MHTKNTATILGAGLVILLMSFFSAVGFLAIVLITVGYFFYTAWIQFGSKKLTAIGYAGAGGLIGYVALLMLNIAPPRITESLLAYTSRVDRVRFIREINANGIEEFLFAVPNNNGRKWQDSNNAVKALAEALCQDGVIDGSELQAAKRVHGSAAIKYQVVPLSTLLDEATKLGCKIAPL